MTAAQEQSGRVYQIDWIAAYVTVQITRSSNKGNWILRGPSTCDRVIVASSESGQTGIQITQAASKPEWLHPRGTVREHASELVPVDPLRRRSRCDVHD